MDRTTIDQVATRVGEHCARTPARCAGHRPVARRGGRCWPAPDLVAHAGAAFRRAAPAGTELSLRVQTNGVRPGRRDARVLARARHRVGVSLDGGRQAHDRHRRYANGRGSYDA